MAQPVTAILSRQPALAAAARLHTDGANEASLIVGRAMARALVNLEADQSEDEVLRTMQRDLDRMILELRRPLRS